MLFIRNFDRSTDSICKWFGTNAKFCLTNETCQLIYNLCGRKQYLRWCSWYIYFVENIQLLLIKLLSLPERVSRHPFIRSFVYSDALRSDCHSGWADEHNTNTYTFSRTTCIRNCWANIFGNRCSIDFSGVLTMYAYEHADKETNKPREAYALVHTAFHFTVYFLAFL